MAASTQVDCDGVCLRMRVAAPFRVGLAREFVDRLGQLCREKGVSLALVDARAVSGEIRFLERFEVGQSLGSALPPGVRLVILAAERMVLPERFVQTVANNRGGNILVTTDPREAAQWLGVALEYVDSTS